MTPAPRLHDYRRKKPRRVPSPSLSSALHDGMEAFKALAPLGVFLSFGLVLRYTIVENIPFPASLTQGLALLGIALVFWVILSLMLLGAVMTVLPWMVLGKLIRSTCRDRAHARSPHPDTREAPGKTDRDWLMDAWQDPKERPAIGICLGVTLLLSAFILLLLVSGLWPMMKPPYSGFQEQFLRSFAFLGIGFILGLPVLYPVRHAPFNMIGFTMVGVVLIGIFSSLDRPLLRMSMQWLQIRSDVHDALVVTDPGRRALVASGVIEGVSLTALPNVIDATGLAQPPERWCLSDATMVWSGLGGPAYVRMAKPGNVQRLVELPAGSIALTQMAPGKGTACERLLDPVKPR